MRGTENQAASLASILARLHKLPSGAARRVLRGPLTEEYGIMELLNSVNRELLRALDMENFLPVILKALQRIPGVENGNLRLRQPDGRFLMVGHIGRLKEQLHIPVLEPGEGFSGLVAQKKEPLFVPDVKVYLQKYSLPEVYKNYPELLEEIKNFACFIGVPIMDENNEVLGTIFVHNFSLPYALDRLQLRVLTMLAAQLGTFLQKSSLLQNQRGQYLDALRLLGRMIDTKDSYTQNHSLQVANLAVEIGRRMGLEEKSLSDLIAAGLLHDIGKIYVSRLILNKTERLNEAEMEEVRSHSARGAAVLQGSRMFSLIAPVVRHHHERYNGRGYPDGLSGEDIPLLSRILCVADSFDAMTSNRPYRLALSREAAVQELLDCSGSQYDPRAVEALLAYQQEIRQAAGGAQLVEA